MRSLALVDWKGKVFWPPPTKFRSTCQVDVAYFPFDDQKCLLKLGSWLHDGFSVSTTLILRISMYFVSTRIAVIITYTDNFICNNDKY